MSAPQAKRAHCDLPRSKSRPWWKTLLDTAVVLVITAVVCSLLRNFVVESFEVPSGSMENTLQVYDRIGAHKFGTVQRGDIVVFRDELSWIKKAPQRPAAFLQPLESVGVLTDSSVNYVVKRVIGTEGDHVVCCNDNSQITVNGKALDEKSYLYTEFDTKETIKPSQWAFDVVVPENRLFVLGDHRDNSEDSRCHLATPAYGSPHGSGFIATSAVVGIVAVVELPLTRLHFVHRPETFTAIPAPHSAPPHLPVVSGRLPDC